MDTRKLRAAVFLHKRDQPTDDATTPDLNRFLENGRQLKAAVVKLAIRSNLDASRLWDEAGNPESALWLQAMHDRPTRPDTKSDNEKKNPPNPEAKTAIMLTKYNKLLAEHPEMTHTDIVNDYMEQKPEAVRKAAKRYPHLVPNKRSRTTGHGPDTD